MLENGLFMKLKVISRIETHSKLIYAEFSLIWNKLQDRAHMYNFNDENVTLNGATLS